MNSLSVFNNGLVKKIRSHFVYVDRDPFSGKRIFFENAGGTLRLKSVLETTNEYTAIPDNAGRSNPASKIIDQAIAKGREDIALLLGAKSGRIIAEQSTTDMIFRVLNTITNTYNKGNMVVSNLDHPSSYDANRKISQRYGMEYRIAEIDPVTGQVPIENIIKHIDKDTVSLTIIHASNIIGIKNDVVNIVKEVRKINPDVFIVLDGAQHASHGKIDVEEYGADAWIFVPYKTYSKVGTSFAYISDRLASLPHDNLLGKPQGYWDLGTREAASYACMSTVVEYFQWLGSNFTDSDDPRTKIVEAMLAIERYEAGLIRALLTGTDKAKGMLDMEHVRVIGLTNDLKFKEAIIAFNIDDTDTVSALKYFEENGVRMHDRISNAYSKHTLDALNESACIRVSLCHYNTIDEANIFLKLLENYTGG